MTISGNGRALSLCIMAAPISRRGNGDAGTVPGITIRDVDSHVLVVCVVEDVSHEQHDCLVADVLPPVRGRIGLRPYVAHLVKNGHRAVACIFDDLAFGHVDDRGAVTVAVPRDDSIRLDRQLAETE